MILMPFPYNEGARSRPFIPCTLPKSHRYISPIRKSIVHTFMRHITENQHQILTSIQLLLTPNLDHQQKDTTTYILNRFIELRECHTIPVTTPYSRR